MRESPAKIIERFRKDIEEKAIRRAAVRALNKAATSVRKEAVKRVRDELKIKAADAKGEAITISKAKNQGLVSSFKATMRIRGSSLPLALFSPRVRIVRDPQGHKRQGVTVNVKGTRKLVKGAFLLKTKRPDISHGQGVFVRDGKGLKGLRTTSFADIFKNKEFIRSLRSYILERVRTVLEQELKYETKKARGEL